MARRAPTSPPAKRQAISSARRLPLASPPHPTFLVFIRVSGAVLELGTQGLMEPAPFRVWLPWHWMLSVCLTHVAVCTGSPFRGWVLVHVYPPHSIPATGPRAWGNEESLASQWHTLQSHSDLSLPSEKGRRGKSPEAGELMTSSYLCSLSGEAPCHAAFRVLQLPGLSRHPALAKPKLRTSKCLHSSPSAHRPGLGRL